jgi:DNA polymerase III alpha subunit
MTSRYAELQVTSHFSFLRGASSCEELFAHAAIRHNVTIDESGFRRERHADRYLKSPEEMARLFSRYPEAVSRTAEIANRCTFTMDELAYQYPEERTMPGLTPQQALEKLTWDGAAERYPEGLPDEVRPKIEHELRLIERLQYAPYFLTVNSIVRSPDLRTSCVKAADRRPTVLSATCSASRRSIRSAMTFSSSASSRRNAASRRTSTSTLSTSAARS